ncbi:MAG: GIY-YIG nuclease family protein [Candidatus Asgardarchaeia archaeon]
MEGAYVLLIKLSEKISLNYKGSEYELRDGLYIYVGSAIGYKNAIEKRVARHIRKDKKVFWHVDRITSIPQSEVLGFFVIMSHDKIECDVSQRLFKSGNLSVPLPRFGASDCKLGCPAHFYYCKNHTYTECIRFLSDVLLKLNKPVLFCRPIDNAFSRKIINRTNTKKLNQD